MTVRGLAIVHSRWLAACLVCAASQHATAAPPVGVVDFNRDVRPVLSENCFACHGPDKAKRKADLRLDTREGLFALIDDVRPVVPGKPQESELYRRVTTHDADDLMPPAKSNKSLTAAQQDLLRRWIEQGAPWKDHWAYEPPQRPPVPAASREGFGRNEVDRFVLAKLDAAGLAPKPEASRATLCRRLYLDLLGLPPTPEQVDAFVADQRPDAYERLVDQLLASPHYGERMAVFWLDLVRYADSIGYHSDNTMEVSPYRDWVIRAFNANEPFDRFTIDQLAGDLVEHPTTSQRVATAYNRLLQTTEEGGAQPKEYRAKYNADRVRNVASAFLGSTMACCECHDHKFDPFKTKDFYSMAAFFADVKEGDVGRREQGMAVPSAEQELELRRLDALIADAQHQLDAPAPAVLERLATAQREWEATAGAAAAEDDAKTGWQVLVPIEMKAAAGTTLKAQADGSIVAGGKTAAKDNYAIVTRAPVAGITGIRLEALPDPALKAGGPGRSENGNFVLTDFKLAVAKPSAGAEAAKEARKSAVPIKPASILADFSQEQFPAAKLAEPKHAGWAILPQTGKPHAAVFIPDAPLGEAGATLIVTLEQQSIFANHNLGRFRLSVTAHPSPASITPLPADVKAALAVPGAQRDAKQREHLSAFYRSIAPALVPVRAELAKHQQAKAELEQSMPRVLVTEAINPPRVVRVLPRGNWLDETGEVVAPNTPGFLPPLGVPAGRRATRLDLARWIVSRDNPLTARVLVNRLWKLCFGTGLSKSLEDCGSQGEWPTHPELLDWLAVECMDHGWDVRHVIRLMVCSATYRQGSTPAPADTERDPFDRLLAHQARPRLDAEAVRDNALAISGLLAADRIGGAPAHPYQPAGYWDYLNFPKRTYEADRGENQYRRGVYTHWQRTFLHPSLLAFDAPTREECVACRVVSNTPQQALVLLNDPTYVEAARAFAARIVADGGTNTADRLRWAFRRALARPPVDAEAVVLTALLDKHRAAYAADPDAAAALLHTGDAPAPPSTADAPELAAWTNVARAILNLNETITRY